MQRLIDEVASTNLGIILDPTNLIRVDIDKTYLEIVEEAFECFGEKIVAFHLKDFIIRNQQIFPVAIGEGQVPLTETIQFLNKHKPGLFTILRKHHLKNSKCLSKSFAISFHLDKMCNKNISIFEMFCCLIRQNIKYTCLKTHIKERSNRHSK